MAQPRDSYRDYVEHPIYGQSPRVTGLNPQDDLAQGIYLGWHSPLADRIAYTAVVADQSKQVSRPIQISHYYDKKRKCRDCGRLFLFFAEEQKFWYETLRFPLEADCVRCFDCRKSQQETVALRERYESLLQKPTRSENETLDLVDCGLTLIEIGIFGDRVIERMRSLLNSVPHESDIRSRGRFTDLLTRASKQHPNTG
jgi:hypothetical protein